MSQDNRGMTSSRFPFPVSSSVAALSGGPCLGGGVHLAMSRGLWLQRSGAVLALPLYNRTMYKTKQPTKMTRKQIAEALDTMPVSHILGHGAKELTAKQKAFAMEVPKGSTGAGAYSKAYNAKGKPKTVGDHASRLKGDDRIKAEIEAMQMAIKAQEYQTPAALRALVIQSLVGVITNPESNAGQITAAAKVLGTVTEVAAFTERKEVRTITSSETARAIVLDQLRALVHGAATDAIMIDDGESLMAELEETAPAAPHPVVAPEALSDEPLSPIHTIPLE